MVNNLDLASLNQFGIDRESPLEARRKASFLFSRARSRASWRTFWYRLHGKQNNLQDLTRLNKQGHRQPAQHGAVVSVPLDKIVGSVGRTHDFDTVFDPLQSHTRDRWIGIAAARRHAAILPPIELLQVGDSYYVQDGNHRVSVAKAAGQAEIDALILIVLNELLALLASLFPPQQKSRC